MKLFLRPFHSLFLVLGSTRLSFSNSAVALQNPNHRLYPTIDWDKVAGGMFAIVDPADPHAVLYLSDRDYKIQVRVSLSTDSPLVVLARAGEVKHVEQLASQQTGSQNMGNVSSVTTPSTQSITSKEVKDSPSKNTPPKGAGGPPNPSTENFFSIKSKKLLARKWHKVFNWAKTTFLNYEVQDADDCLVSINNKNIADLIKRWGTLSQHWSGRGLSPHTAIELELNQISAHLLKVLNSEGPNGVILLLKLTSVCIRRFLAGNPVTDSWELGHPIRVRKSGVPLWLPLKFRRFIRARNTEGLRLVFSILNAYKGFKSPYKKMDLSNITSPHPVMDEGEIENFSKWCREVFWPKVVKPCARDFGKPDLLKVIRDDGSVQLPEVAPPFLRTAGPNASVSTLGAALDAQAWNLEPINWLVEYLEETKDQQTLDTFNAVLKESTPGFLSQTLPGLFVVQKAKGQIQTKLRELRLGKLSLKLEAAGKKRIFAIVDYWTQRALKPLHTWMADVLSVLPSDATFDQNGAVRRFAHSEPSACHSYDLKAATDTIPQVLYESLFKAILPEVLVDKWIALLTDRWYYTPESERKDHPDLPIMVRYSRGQPMGALSSWPSMALVHHAVILYSAWKTGRPVAEGLWWDYRVLGDDSIIGDQEVGLAYTAQTNSFHIVIGKKVSLISAPALQRALVAANHVCTAISRWVFTPSGVAAFKAYRRVARIVTLGPMFEFANQFWLGKVDLSPASLKQELGIRTGSQRVEYALRILLRWETGSQGSWVARLCRYLLPPTLYGESVRHWKQGRLGPILQLALTIAFGPFSTLTRKVGLQWSSLEPLLLVLTNSSKILMGRGSSLLRLGPRLGGIDDLVFSLCVSYFRVLLREIEGVRIKMSQLMDEDDAAEGGLEAYLNYGSRRPSVVEIAKPVPKGSCKLFSEFDEPTGIHWLLKELLLNAEALRVHMEIVSNEEEYGSPEDYPLQFSETNFEKDWEEIVELQTRLNRLIVLYTKGLSLREEYTTVSSLVTYEESGVFEAPNAVSTMCIPTLGSDLIALEAVSNPFERADEGLTLDSVEPGHPPELTPFVDPPWRYYLSQKEGTFDTEFPPLDQTDQWDITPEDISGLDADTAASDLYEAFRAVAEAPTLDECYTDPSKLFSKRDEDDRVKKGSFMETIQAYRRLVSATAPALEYLDFESGIAPEFSIFDTKALADMWQGSNQIKNTSSGESDRELFSPKTKPCA